MISIIQSSNTVKMSASLKLHGVQPAKLLIKGMEDVMLDIVNWELTLHQMHSVGADFTRRSSILRVIGKRQNTSVGKCE